MMFQKLFKVRGELIEVRLEDHIRELLRTLMEELRELLIVDERDTLQRLYPTAYPENPELGEQFDNMLHDQLLMARLDGLDTVQSTLESTEIDEATADAWLASINQVRLVLGTRLDVSEDDGAIEPDDPDAQAHAIYQLCSHILDELTRARTKLL